MDNKNITIYNKGKFIDVDYDFFINQFILTKFFINNEYIINKFMFEILKIKDEDKQRILKSFRDEIFKIEEDLINNQEKDDYLDKLYTYLKDINFDHVDNQIKIKVLNHLKVKNYLKQKIIDDFTIKTIDNKS